MPTSLRSARRGALAALGLVAAVALAGCAPATTDAGTPSPSDGDGSWPRTVTVADRDVEIPAEPVRVVALSTETGDIALELVGHDRVAAVSNGSVTEGSGNQIDEAEQVETALPSGTTPDPEQILALEPDLVLMTSRHEGEQEAAAVLEESGVPSLVFDSASFETVDGIVDAVQTIGDALGAEEEAAAIADRMTTERDAVLDAIADDPVDTTVLLLMSRGGKQFIQSEGSAMSTLVSDAGGTVVGASASAVPADPELIVAADPDVILVEDFQDQGMSPFADLLDGDALASVPAIADDRVHAVSAAIASGTSGTRTVEGLSAIAGILHPDVSL